MVRVIHKRIIAFLLCVALTFGAVSAAKPTEAKAAFVADDVIVILITALASACGMAVTDIICDDVDQATVAGYIHQVRDDLGNSFLAYIDFAFATATPDIPAISIDNEHIIMLQPLTIGEDSIVKNVVLDPELVNNLYLKLQERGTSLMEIMQRLRDCGVTTYQSFVSALKDILKDTANVLVNDQTKAMFNAILQVTSNAAREVARANGGGFQAGITYKDINNTLDFVYSESFRHKELYEKFIEQKPDYNGVCLLFQYYPYGSPFDIDVSNKPIILAIDTIYDLNKILLSVQSGGTVATFFIPENGSYRLTANFNVYYLNDSNDLISKSCSSDYFYWRYSYDYVTDFMLLNNKEFTFSGDFDSISQIKIFNGIFDYSKFLDGIYSKESVLNQVYTGLPDVSVLENAGSLDALVEQAKSKDDTVAWINPNAQVADADADAAEAEALASQVTLINQGIDKSNSWLESIFNSIRGMATTVTNIFDVLSTGLSKMLTGAADRVVEGFQDIFIDDVGDNVLERACTGIDNLVEGVGDLAGLKEAVEAIEAATGEQVKLLTAEDAVAAELKTQFGGADLNGLFKLVYLLIYILIKLLFLFLRCLSLIVVVFKVPATTGFLPDGMIQGLNWIKAFEIPNFNINLWDFMFLLIYIVLTFRVIGAIKHHIDKISL